MRLKELETPLNSMRQDVVDRFLSEDGDEMDKAMLIYHLYGKEGLVKAIESGELSKNIKIA